jgi:dolichol-phosphate mannosyltransferase
MLIYGLFSNMIDGRAVIASSPRTPTVMEVPYTFRPRLAGASKLDTMVVREYGLLLADKTISPTSQFAFSLLPPLDGLGVVVHFGVLTTLLKGFDLASPIGQASATVVTLVFDFAVNNVSICRDRRLRELRWLGGLVRVMLACQHRFACQRWRCNLPV